MCNIRKPYQYEKYIWRKSRKPFLVDFHEFILDLNILNGAVYYIFMHDYVMKGYLIYMYGLSL